MATNGEPTTNRRLLEWAEEWAAILAPDAVHWCDGSSEEYDLLAAELVSAGTFQRLNDDLRPNSYLALSDPGDVARVETAPTSPPPTRPTPAPPTTGGTRRP